MNKIDTYKKLTALLEDIQNLEWNKGRSKTFIVKDLSGGLTDICRLSEIEYATVSEILIKMKKDEITKLEHKLYEEIQ